MPVKAWTAPSILIAFAIGIVVIGGFFVWELSYDSPMLDVNFFRSPRFTAASGAITLSFFTLFGMLFLLTQYLQSVLLYSPLKAGAVLIPQALVIMVVATASSSFVQRFGNKVVVSFGMTVVAISLIAVSRLQVAAPMWQVIVTTMLMGLGMGNVMAPATDSVMGSLPREKAGVGSAVNDTTRQVGGAAGVAVLGSIMASSYRNNVLSLLNGHQLPGRLGSTVSAGIGQALGVAGSPASGRLGPVIANAAQHAYVSSFHTAALVGAVIMFIGAAGVFTWLPARAPNEMPGLSPATPPAATAPPAAGPAPVPAAATLETTAPSPGPAVVAGGEHLTPAVERS